MVGVIEVFAVIFGIIIIGFLAELMFKKTKIPDVLFLILIGILLGPVLGWVDKDGFGLGSTLFTTFTLLFLLFQGALNIEFKSLFRSLKGTLKLTLISFILTVGIVTLMSFYLLKYPLNLSILIGVILGGTSSAVVIPFVNNLSIDKKYGNVLTLESAITDILCIVGAIALFAVILGQNVSPPEIIKSLISSFLLAIVIGILGAMMWIFLLSKSKLLIEAHMVTIAWVLGIYAFVESPFVKASGAISVLSFGLMLGNSHPILRFYDWISKKDTISEQPQNLFLEENVLSERAKSFYSEISFFVKVFFFVYLGILFDFTNPMVFAFGALITLGIFIVRPIAVKLSFWNEDIDKKTKNALRIMVPKGLVTAVLGGIAVQMAIPQSNEILSLVFSVILISIVFTSILVFMTQREGYKIIPQIDSKKAAVTTHRFSKK